ncbi:MAG: BLUF domain-containing protein [Wenzhouxiangella sp.]|nr:MAG: BLUF domain-containing protein [Wenzhouxiangella sp.]
MSSRAFFTRPVSCAYLEAAKIAVADLLRLVYASEINFEPSTDGSTIDPVISGILAQSRRNNAPRNIGGVLCYGDGFFFQCLEGERWVVETLYDRLLGDERHRNMTLLSKRPVAQRMFKLWSMKFMNVDARIRRMLQIENLESFEPHSFSDLMVERLLIELRDASEKQRPAPLSTQGWSGRSRQAGATRELMPGLMFATATGVIAIIVGLMLAGLL